MIKKIATFMMGLALISSSSLAFVSADAQNPTTDNTTPALTTKFWVNNTNTSGIGIAGAGVDQKNSLLTVVKNFINFVLWLLGLITLIMLLWWGFNMVTSAGDNQKFGDGMKILKNAGIGLAFIALSWMMVSMIFWVIWQIGGWVS